MSMMMVLFCLFVLLGQVIVVILFLIAIWRTMLATEKIAGTLGRFLPVQDRGEQNLKEVLGDLSPAERSRINKAIQQQHQNDAPQK